MLKDKLEQLAVQPKGQALCAVGAEMVKMNKEDLDSFINAMCSQASSADILKVLKEEGINSFGISHLRDKRRQCFSPDNPCPCIQKAKS